MTVRVKPKRPVNPFVSGLQAAWFVAVRSGNIVSLLETNSVTRRHLFARMKPLE